MPILIFLNAQVYQAPESVIRNHRVLYFHDLGLSYSYLNHKRIIAIVHICKNKKPCVYVYKTFAKAKEMKKYIFHIFVLSIIFYKLVLPKYNSS